MRDVILCRPSELADTRRAHPNEPIICVEGRQGRQGRLHAPGQKRSVKVRLKPHR